MDELRCSERISCSCSTSGTRRVNLVINPVISHEWRKDHIVITTKACTLWEIKELCKFNYDKSSFNMKFLINLSLLNIVVNIFWILNKKSTIFRNLRIYWNGILFNYHPCLSVTRRFVSQRKVRSPEGLTEGDLTFRGETNRRVTLQQRW